MKLIADGMLGRLTRWLRMLGHDVKYSAEYDDAEFLKIAKKEQRTLLTRDLALYQQAVARGIDAFYVDGQTEEEKLAKLAKRFGIELNIDMATSRCPKCNAQVEPTEKEKVKGRIEKDTFAYYKEFWRCPRCGQIYWQGSHWDKINRMLEAARLSLKNQNKAKQSIL